jgi:hypothetical protein
MSRAKHSVRHRRRSLLLAAGLAAALVAAAGVAIAQFGSTDKPGAGSKPTVIASGDASAHSGSHPPSQPSAAPSANPTVSAAAACSAHIRTTEAVLAAARTAAGHWHEHVQARTDLLSGKNSVATTKAIWKRTRLAGPADIAKLKTATDAQVADNGGCAKLSRTAAAGCRQRLTALDWAAAANRAAAADWANHLAMMAAHAAGDFGREHAQDMWVAAWSGAAKNLNAAARADAALAKTSPCHPA